MLAPLLAIDLHLGVRTLHVVAAMFAVGVPAGLALVLRAHPAPEVVERLVADAERLQWIVLAILVATGVGNLAAPGEGTPEPSSQWGRVLIAKLGLVLLLLVLSAVRTFVIATQRMRAVHQQRLGTWYGVTAAVGVCVAVLAEVLAHG